jgi:hypothetical protein
MSAQVPPSRLSRLADRRDIGLFVVVGLALFAFTVVWALFLADINIPVIGQNLFMLLVVMAASAIVAFIPRISWGSSETRPGARLMVRLGMGMQIFGLIITPVGLFYETNPVISVPIGFASFLTVFFGVFIAGFGGNMLAPPRA